VSHRRGISRSVGLRINPQASEPGVCVVHDPLVIRPLIGARSHVVHDSTDHRPGTDGLDLASRPAALLVLSAVGPPEQWERLPRNDLLPAGATQRDGFGVHRSGLPGRLIRGRNGRPSGRRTGHQGDRRHTSGGPRTRADRRGDPGHPRCLRLYPAPLRPDDGPRAAGLSTRSDCCVVRAAPGRRVFQPGRLGPRHLSVDRRLSPQPPPGSGWTSKFR
jgi:hypothetical protein